MFRSDLTNPARAKSAALHRHGAMVAALLATTAAMPALAQSTGTVTNPGFETGDTSGWTSCGGYWTSGNWPVTEAECSGPANLLQVMNTGTFDAVTGAPTVFAGNHSVRLNDQYGGYDLTALSQTVTNYNGNKLYYAWNAVLEPSHGPEDSPSFLIKVVDKTTNTIVTNISYSAYTAQNTTLFRDVNGFVTTDWKVEDVDVTNGHDYELVFVAVDCLYSGHGGYVYVDGFGNVIPTPNAGVSFDPSKDVVKGSSILIPIGGTPDIDTAVPFYTLSQLAAGAVNPNFVGGTLQADGTGPVANAFTVQTQGGTIDTNGNDVLFSGAFTGAGGLAKTGAGKLTLSAISTISGAFDVNAGTLNVTGTLSNLAVNVNSGGTLTGNGNVVAPINVNNGGTLNPGDSIGALKVAGGNVTMNTGSKLVTEIDGRTYNAAGGAGSYDRLVLSGGNSGFVAGGTISPVLRGIAGGNNTFAPVLGDRFTVVTADSVTGQFASVLQPTAGMPTNRRFDVLYGTKDVQLVLTPGSFAALGVTDAWKLNGLAAATGLDAVRPAAGTRSGHLQSLFNGLYGMDATQYRRAFQQMSGEMHAHNILMANVSSRETASSVLDAASSVAGCDGSDERQGADGKRAACDDGRNHVAVWTRLSAQHQEAGDTPASYGFDANRYGFVSGINLLNTADTRVGLGGGYYETNADDPMGSSSRLREGTFFAYGSHNLGPVNLGATLGWSSTDAYTKRTMNLLSGNQMSSGAYTMETFYGSIEARMSVPVGDNAEIRPVAGLGFAHTKAKASTEVNGDANLALVLPEETWKTAHTKLGAEAAFGLGTKVQGMVFGNWQHQIDGDETASRLVRLGNASWRAASDSSDGDAFEFGAALGMSISSRAKVRVEYRGVRDGERSSDRGSVGVAIAL
ncbi:MAG: autotransporter domain-containing protein [Novosphingobium sp.]|nr:autotransporter domain-containing protein [Novosphingobium sp.]